MRKALIWDAASQYIAFTDQKPYAFKQHTGPGGWNDADFIYTGGEGCADNKPLEHLLDRLTQSTALSSVCGALWGRPFSLPQILET